MFGLTLTDLTWLLAIGVLFSGAIYFIFEAIKRRRWGAKRPTTKVERSAFYWGPVLVAMVLTVPLFPLALEGLKPGLVDELTSGHVWIFPRQTVFMIIVLVVGAVGGLGSKLAHDYAKEWILKALDSIGGGQDDGTR